MKEFISKGEKAAFLTRDLIYKVSSLQKLVREERKLVNSKLISQAIKEVSAITDKIYENVRVYDVSGKLATIDLQSIEVTQQQQTMDLVNESSICNFYNGVVKKQGDGSFSNQDKQKITIITNQQQLIEELHARIENIEAENELLKRDKDAIMKKVSTHHQSFASNSHPDQRMAPLLLSETDSHFQQKLQGINAAGFKNRAEQSERDCQGIIASSDPGI